MDFINNLLVTAYFTLQLVLIEEPSCGTNVQYRQSSSGCSVRLPSVQCPCYQWKVLNGWFLVRRGETQDRKSCFWFLSLSFHILNTKCLNKLPVCMLNRCLVFAQAVKLTVFALVWTNTKFSFSVNFFQQRASATTSPRSQARDTAH